MPELVFRHIDDVPYREVKAQMHGDRRVGVHLKFMESHPNRTIIYTHYDPDLVLERHGHSSDHVIFILKGSLSVGGTECPPGTMVLLEHGAAFGPLVAGPEGTELIEFYTGEVTPVPADVPAYEALLEERGIVEVETDFQRSAG
jgi:hypothetical protein